MTRNNKVKQYIFTTCSLLCLSKRQKATNANRERNEQDSGQEVNPKPYSLLLAGSRWRGRSVLEQRGRGRYVI